MNNKVIALIVVNFMVIAGGTLAYRNRSGVKPVVVVPKSVLPDKPPELPPVVTAISNPLPNYLNYEQTVVQLKKWNEEAKDLTEIGVYGKSTLGKELYYLRLINKRTLVEKPRIMLTACIHGNEPLSASTLMAWLGNLLDRYGKDAAITELLDSRDIYFIPIVSPDSYPNSRYVDGVDPNRNFPTQNDPTRRSVTPIHDLQEFFLKIKPQAVISTHTWGRVCLVPWGDQMVDCPDALVYKQVVGKMAEAMGYRYMRACDMYGPNGLNNPPIRAEYATMPIYGSEVDWYYRNGAMAIVLEVGTHQKIPSKEDIKTEFSKTIPGILYFIKTAPITQLKMKGN